MPKIKFISHDGAEYLIDAEVGESVMKAAVNASIPSILGDCGGTASCATCHGYVDNAWIDRIPAASDDERAMLECVLDPQENSRLVCQIDITEELDQIVIHLPESQT